MSDDKNDKSLPPFVDDGSQDTAATFARNEDHRRRQEASIIASAANAEWVPQPLQSQPFYLDDGSQDAAIFAINSDRLRRQNFAAVFSTMQGSDEEYVPPNTFPVLVSQSVLIPFQTTSEGQLVRAATLPLIAIIRMIQEDPSRMFQIDPRKWEEIIAAAYDESREFDEVTLTPRSGDRGRDVIAVKKGFGSVRLIESVKRYKPGHVVSAEEVQALLGVLHGDHQATKGIVSTTWEFAPKIGENPHITQYIPHRLELINGTDLVRRLAEYTGQKSK